MKTNKLAKELKGNEFKIYSVIESRNKNYSNKQLADRCNVTQPTIKRNLNNLIERGYIERNDNILCVVR